MVNFMAETSHFVLLKCVKGENLLSRQTEKKKQNEKEF